MKRFLSSSVISFLAVLLTICVPVSGQITLRNAVDQNGDFKADLLIFRPSEAQWYGYRADGSIIVTPFGIANEDYPVPGDYDGDDKGDIAVWRDTDGHWYRLHSSNFLYYVTGWGLPGDEPVARDYDGDGTTDLAVARRSGGIITWYVAQSSNGLLYSVPFGFSTDYLAPGDYDGDGHFDLAVQRPGPTGTSLATFYIQNAVGYQEIQWGFSNDLVVPGDYDNDGKTDIAVVREGNTPDSVLTWFVRPSGSPGNPIVQFWGLTGTDLTVQNDYNGDGITDFAVWRNSDGQFYILLGGGSGIIYTFPWGLPNDYPVASYDTH